MKSELDLKEKEAAVSGAVVEEAWDRKFENNFSAYMVAGWYEQNEVVSLLEARMAIKGKPRGPDIRETSFSLSLSLSLSLFFFLFFSFSLKLKLNKYLFVQS